MATRFDQGSAFDKISMDQIIGAPLRATATANSLMAKEQVKFMMEFCFKQNEDNFEPVMIEMIMTTSRLEHQGGDDDDSPVVRVFNTRFNLPLLTLIPLNSLAVDTFEIDFDMEVTSVEKEERAFQLSDADPAEDLKLMGKVSNSSGGQKSRNSQYEKKIDSKLSINIKGGQLPLPVGLSSILDLYKNNIEPIEIAEQ